MVSVYFASALRTVTQGVGQVEIEAFDGNLALLFDRLEERWGPRLRERLFEAGELRRFVNVYIDGQDVRFLGGLSASVRDSSTVDLIPAVAGG